ncbi:hypothetical protein QBC37DRAFT_108721 [Rhypophila decipiens]|uniref:FHA domain-containing protein n=1 Tax=Rhypophila decipiens TaxID=261697 RepID=A0AAN7BBC5_9PEZI|nr:hypothetical protein QBC37DRAFT_108721 [Rhypophila decipiens]
MADSVIITLSLDEGQDIPHPHRELVLDRKNNSVVVGRSSKVETKGLVSLPSNAWFRSPVMSRNHAEIVANLDDKKVIIKDLGSLHGTFLNDEKDRLEKGEVREVRNGDKLQLGVSIFRGSDSFPPTTLDIGIEYREKKRDVPTSTFQVPDCSDVEDYSSDCPSDAREVSGQECRPRIVPNAARAVIDLTDLPPKMAVSQVIDLSSPPCSPLSIVDLDESTSVFELPLSDIGPRVPDQTDQTLAQETSSRIASPDLSTTSPNFDAFSPSSPYHDGSSDYGGSVHPSTDGEAEDEDEEMMDRHDFGLNGEINDGEASDLVSVSGQSSSSGLSDPEDYSDSERDEESEGYDEDARDDYSSEDEEDTGFPDEVFRSAFWDESPAKLFVAPLPLQPLESPKAVKSSNLEIRKLLNDEKASYFKEAARVEPQASYSAPTVFTPRDVSPSDAVIARASCTQKEKPKNGAGVTVLGGMIGKEEFFAAREHNKFLAKLQSEHQQRSSVHSLCNEAAPSYSFSLAPVSPMGQFLKRNTDTRGPEIGQHQPPASWYNHVYNKDFEVAKPLARHLADLAESAKPAEPAKPVEPVQTVQATEPAEPAEPAEAAQPAQSAELAEPAEPVVSDDTATSPEATKSSEQVVADDQSLRRSHLGISDIVEDSLPAVPVHQDKTTKETVSTKRKADDISSSTVQEEEWVGERAEKPVTVSIPTQPSPVADKVFAPLVSGTTVSREIDGRPAKRLRHIAERVGYAALGGVTAGAMIFGTLVYTAPTFV